MSSPGCERLLKRTTERHVDEKPLTLTDAELVDLTRKTRPTAQQRALRFMGIEHRTRPDGSVVVDRTHYLWLMDGAKGRKPKTQPFEIDWD